MAHSKTRWRLTALVIAAVCASVIFSIIQAQEQRRLTPRLTEHLEVEHADAVYAAVTYMERQGFEALLPRSKPPIGAVKFTYEELRAVGWAYKRRLRELSTAEQMTLETGFKEYMRYRSPFFPGNWRGED